MTLAHCVAGHGVFLRQLRATVRMLQDILEERPEYLLTSLVRVISRMGAKHGERYADVDDAAEVFWPVITIARETSTGS